MNSNKPLISVVIPTYGRPQNLYRAVMSVINQKYCNVEIIVVDDNNPDTPARAETEKVMGQFTSNPRVIYLQHETNKNGSAARNTGWKASKGEYIAFLDDDDEFLPDKLAMQVECMEALDDSWGACYTGYHILRKNGKVEQSGETRSGNLYVKALMRTLYIMGGSNLFVRRKVVEEIDGFDETFKRNQDLEFLVRILEKYKLACVNQDCLCIHLEVRDNKKTFEEVDAIAVNYLNVFRERIEKLEVQERKKVLAVISIERARVAMQYKMYDDAFQILVQNRVRLDYIVRYAFYIVKRIYNKRSVGFSL